MNYSYYYLLTNLVNEDEKRVITSIVKHIEDSTRKVGIQQIAEENHVSTAFIMKLCKRLGFEGYSELFYYLAMQSTMGQRTVDTELTLQGLVSNYEENFGETFCQLLREHRQQKIFVVGAGFADLVAEYIAQRLAVCGFQVFHRVLFYDYMLFKEEGHEEMVANVEPSLIIAISQSGETETVLTDVNLARRRDFQVVSFTRRLDSSLAERSDLTFVINPARQTLITEVPNSFFGKVILVFEELMGLLFA